MTTRVGTANIKDTLSDADALDALHKVLTHLEPNLLGVTEWDGGMAKLSALDYLMVRAVGGGSPLVYDSGRYHLVKAQARTLVGSGSVGRLVGRKSTLPASKAATYHLREMDKVVVVIVIHLTAEVQRDKGYRRDVAHLRRVVRHRAERAQLAALVRLHQQRGRRVFVVGDTNYDQMLLPPLTSCWKGRRGGTLGNRAVDAVFASQPAIRVQTIETASDHDAVVATYVY